jgi:hypothetical protein
MPVPYIPKSSAAPIRLWAGVWLEVFQNGGISDKLIDPSKG